MANLQEKLIESMLKDLQNSKDFDQGKVLRKECSLLQKRIVSARKLFPDDKELEAKLREIESEIDLLKKSQTSE